MPIIVEAPEPRSGSVSATEVTADAAPAPDTITIPDLVSHCDFNIHCNPKVETAVEESKSWLFEHGQLGEKRKNAFRGLKAGGEVLPASHCYDWLILFLRAHVHVLSLCRI